MSSLESKLNLQQSRINLMKNDLKPFLDEDSQNLTKAAVKTRLEVLEATWTKFDRDHDRICECKPEIQKELPYIIEDHYSIGREAYMESKSAIVNFLDKLIPEQRSTHSTSSTSNPMLPKIPLIKFSGDYQSWKPFSDIFQSLVSSNPDLSDVAKMHYLKSCLTDEAAQLVSNLQISAENFQTAWNKLVSRYENKRVLINKHLDVIFKLKQLPHKSAKGLNNLLSTMNESLSLLKALGSPTEKWDNIIVYMIVNRLDPETHEAWELHQGVSTESSSLQELQTFIEGRVRALENIEARDVSNASGMVNLPPQGKPQHNPKINAAVVVESQSKGKISCKLCDNTHYLVFCKEFHAKTPIQRREFLVNKRLCFNCLGPHLLKECRSQKSCVKCGNRHHTLIHDAVIRSTECSSHSKSTYQPPKLPSSESKSSDTPQVSSNHSLPTGKRDVVLLATAQVKVIGPKGNSIVSRALIDQGSEISFISEYLVQTLHLERSSSSLSLIGIGGNQSSTTRGLVFLNIGSPSNNNVICPLTAHILPKLTANLPTMTPGQSNWPHIKKLKLADHDFMTPGSVDLILGADVYGNIILPGLIKGPPLTPIAQSTIFGWVLSGPSGFMVNGTNSSMYHCLLENKVDELLQKFWEQEDFAKDPVQVLSPENQTCEEHFQSTHSRTESGRYIVKLPLKESAENLGDSRPSALKVLNSMKNRFLSDPNYQNLYSNFISEYESLDHMSKVESDSVEKTPTFYLPHHGVLRETSSTTKLRVVFNGSKRTSTGKSLNDILHTGEKLQTNLSDVLIRFRQFKYVFSTDIEKMYRQILVHPDDWDLQRILWYDNDQLCTYQLKTITYGLSCAPFLALRTMNQLVIDHGNQYPLGTHAISKGRYVDDIFGGADTIEESQEVVKQVDQLCLKGCFPLQKWISNDLSTLVSISSERYVKEASVSIKESTTVRTLGLTWKPASDDFQFQIDFQTPVSTTKRSVLSHIAKLFDPLGFIAPVIVQAKVFMQQLWLIKLSWDDILPPYLLAHWQSFESQLKELPNISIPRYLGITKSSSCCVELHGFSDASQSAMAAVTYIKVKSESGIFVNIVCAKTRVASLRKMSIPRLELTAALMLVRLAKYVREILNIKSAPLWLWTDSRVTLTWVKNHPSKWKDFVCNRVSIIQETEPLARWRYVPGKENPADCASRGLSPKALKDHKLWWSGPSWLAEDSAKWPMSSNEPAEEAVSEQRSQKSTHLSQSKSEPDLLCRYSNLNKLLRITAWCKRFTNRLRKIDKLENTTPYLTPKELNNALQTWIGIVQREAFAEDLKLLSNQKLISKLSKLRNFTPFLDQNKLIRVGGRLNQSALEYDTKHPLLLPKDSTLSKLIISDAHLRTLHGSTSITLSTIRQCFWILGGRPTIKKELLRCVTCARYRAERAQQLMGQLPSSRVTPSRPFLHSGVDYAGPFLIKTWRGRAAKTYKGYIVVFICSSTSALHLELVTDYSAEAFIAAYKRFTARRGLCSTLSSDCGTTFIGADAELKRLFTASTTECNKLRDLLTKDGTLWKFNPPSAPHFGGHWEAGVKSVKYHLKRIVGNTLLTYEEFSTVLTQIEGVLNSRPLCKLTDDPDDLSTLTPAHFLVGESLSTIPEPDLNEVPTNRLSRWQLLQQMLQSFWKRWSKEYLQQLQTIYKWRFPNTELQVGSIVLITDEQYPPSKWPLAKVIEVHPGPDNLIRVVTLKTATGTLKRPIAKLCPLPINIVSP